jgi:hypothetical protein
MGQFDFSFGQIRKKAAGETLAFVLHLHPGCWDSNKHFPTVMDGGEYKDVMTNTVGMNEFG